MGQAIVSVNIDMESIHELCEIFPQQIEKGRHITCITVHCSVSGTFWHQERNGVITTLILYRANKMFPCYPPPKNWPTTS